MNELALERLRDWRAGTAIVLGSGLNALAEGTPEEQTISYAEFPALPKPTVEGHGGKFVLAQIADVHVIYAQGRVHLYEGRSAQEVTASVRLLASAGVKRIIFTNAAGSVNENFAPGTWMMISDHLNLTGTTPLLGRPEFIDMSDVYSAAWRSVFAGVAVERQLILNQGVYAGLLGPQYETPSEVRMLRSLGADAVGMSTVLEAIQARALGIEVAAFSCLTNWAAGISAELLSHAEVLATGKAAAGNFSELLRGAIAATDVR